MPRDDLGPLSEKSLRKRLSEATSKVIEEEIRTFLEDVLAEVKRRILRQALPTGPPLSERYLAFKKRTGLDLRTLIATGSYFNSLGIHREDDGSFTIRPSKDKLQSANLTFEQLSRLLEYGTETMPARPHWRPAAAYAKRKAARLRRAMAAKISASVNDPLDKVRRKKTK